jgi:hypothetical protein
MTLHLCNNDVRRVVARMPHVAWCKGLQPLYNGSQGSKRAPWERLAEGVVIFSPNEITEINPSGLPLRRLAGIGPEKRID